MLIETKNCYCKYIVERESKKGFQQLNETISYLTKYLRNFCIFFILGITIIPINGVNASPLEDFFSSVKKAIPFNPFDTVGMEFNRLVDAEEFDKAEKFFSENYTNYFDKRFNKDNEEVTQQLRKLGQRYAEKNYTDKALNINRRLQAIKQLYENVDNNWTSANVAMAEAEILANEIGNNNLLRTSQVGANFEKSIRAELASAQEIARRDRAKAIASTFDEVLKTGVIPSGYPQSEFIGTDYKNSDLFQKQIVELISRANETEQIANLKLLEAVTDTSTLDKFVRGKRLKEAILKLGPAPYSLAKLSELRVLVKEFGDDSGLQKAVKIGYIDITATSFKDRNIFDFQLAFEKDYGIDISDAQEDFIDKGNTSGYDFLFVTDLSAAKIYREFKNKREIGSKAQSGTREEQNPEYVTALSAYQNAMTNMQSTKLQNAASANQPCYGSALACILAGALKGVSNGVSENDFKNKSNILSQTPQMVTKPVYSKYNYQLVDINASKVARVEYFVIDVRNKKYYSNYFEIKDNEKFTVSYNVEESDPDNNSILKNNQKEEDVTAWEKKPISIKLSTLFDPTNIIQNSSKTFTTIDAFLKPLSTRSYASAKPTYSSDSVEKNDPKGNFSGNIKGSTAVAKADIKNSSTRNESGAVADERFDSVMIVKTSKAIGTGFYVTPDLVLTAYHVVDGSKGHSNY